MSALHIATSIRIIRKHRGVKQLGVAGVRDEIKHAALKAGTPSELRADQLMREELERRTRLSIGELALVAEEWPD